MKAAWKALIALACVAHSLSCAAQAYPDKPIKIYHGFAAGGGADVLLRTILPELSANLGQQIVVEYRPGAGGNIAMEAVARAAPDGYTLLMGTPGLAINPSLYASLPFDPMKDFAPISLIGTVQNVLIVNPGLPAKNVGELIALAKAKPGKLNFASSGTGTSLHLAAELFKVSTAVDIVHNTLGGVTEVIYLAALALAASALGTAFRLYSITTFVILLSFGVQMVREAPRVGTGGPTPLIGVWQRINIGVFVLWVIVLAIVLLVRGHEKDRRAPLHALAQPA